jgi:hypothetical protein
MPFAPIVNVSENGHAFSQDVAYSRMQQPDLQANISEVRWPIAA